MAKNRMNSAAATALVDAALGGMKMNYGVINSLRNFLLKEKNFSKDNKQALEAEIKRLPKFKLANQKYSYAQWTTFQLWIARTLKANGHPITLSKDALETFYRVASKEEQNEMTKLLG